MTPEKYENIILALIVLGFFTLVNSCGLLYSHLSLDADIKNTQRFTGELYNMTNEANDRAKKAQKQADSAEDRCEAVEREMRYRERLNK